VRAGVALEVLNVNCSTDYDSVKWKKIGREQAHAISNVTLIISQ